MKRFFILASAAIVALASCAKTEVVYKDAPEQIAFKQITGAMTKAFGNSTTLGVFAYKNSDKHFENLEFAHNGTAWTNSDAFWPYEGALTFTVYAPKGTASLAGDVLTLTGVEANEDLYYGAGKYTASKTDGNAPVDVVLKHVSAKVTVNCNLAAPYQLVSLTLMEACTGADVTVDYSSSTVAVTGTQVKENLDVTTTSTQYVLPGNQTYFTIVFKQGDLSFSQNIALSSTWVANHAYTYNITVNAPDQIFISASVDSAGWQNGGTVNETVSSEPELS